MLAMAVSVRVALALAGNFELKKICKWAAKKNFTHLIVLTEKAKQSNGCVRAEREMREQAMR